MKSAIYLPNQWITQLISWNTQIFFADYVNSVISSTWIPRRVSPLHLMGKCNLRILITEPLWYEERNLWINSRHENLYNWGRWAQDRKLRTELPAMLNVRSKEPICSSKEGGMICHSTLHPGETYTNDWGAHSSWLRGGGGQRIVCSWNKNGGTLYLGTIQELLAIRKIAIR